MASATEVDRLRERVARAPEDEELRVRLGAAEIARGDPAAGADQLLQAALLARDRGDGDAASAHLRACLEADPLHPLIVARATPQPTTEPGSIVVAHREPRVVDAVIAALTARGHQAVGETGAAAAIDAIVATRPDLVVSGPQLADGDALTVLRGAGRARPDVARVLLTAAVRGEALRHATELQPLVDEHLDRPLTDERLGEAVAAALWRQRHATRPSLTGAPAPATTSGTELARAALIIAAGYAVILSANLLLQQEAIRTLDQARAELTAADRFAATRRPDRAVVGFGHLREPDLEAWVQVIDPLAEPLAAGDDDPLLRESAHHLQLELTVSGAPAELRPEELVESVRLRVRGGELSPLLQPWLRDVDLEPGVTVDPVRAGRLVVVTAFARSALAGDDADRAWRDAQLFFVCAGRARVVPLVAGSEGGDGP